MIPGIIKGLFPEVTEDEFEAAKITANKFGKIYTKEAGDHYCNVLDNLRLGREGIDVGNIVRSLLNPDPLSLSEIPEQSLYTIGNVAVNFQRQGDTVIMRVVERKE